MQAKAVTPRRLGFFRFSARNRDPTNKSMPLGLLAKDSIQDLEALGREAAKEENGEKDTVSTENDNHDASSDDVGDETGLMLEMDDDASKEEGEGIAVSAESTTPVESTASTETRTASTYGSYSGFAYDYADNREYYEMSSYAAPSEVKPALGFWQSLLPCLFPWTTHATAPQLEESNDFVHQQEKVTTNEMAVSTARKKLARSSSGGDNDDNVSTGSDALGEKLSSRERQAVLARLRLAQPEAGDENQEADPGPKKGLLNDLQHYESPSNTPNTNIRGILKRRNAAPVPSNGEKETDAGDGEAGRNPTRRPSQRRMLFPQVDYDTTTSTEKSTTSKNVAFAPMARVVTVKSKNDMNMAEKSAIWWQRTDYDDFRKTGRTITRAMLEGGSELWLNSERCNGKGSLRPGDSDDTDTITATGDKWWHRFGHSRRGLEHVVSVEEGRQRQVNVRSAIRAVVDEQTRQRMYNRVDPDKLRMVSLQYTSWARDLALASGQSDADAVKLSFSDERKTREFFLLKMARGKNGVASSGRHVPEFMQPALHGVAPPKAPTAPHRLDANTSAQLRYRRRVSQKPPPPPPSKAALEPKNSFNTESEQKEAVIDRNASDGSMARRAAGFSADGAEKVDMAAVLSGMGAVPRSTQVMSTA